MKGKSKKQALIELAHSISHYERVLIRLREEHPGKYNDVPQYNAVWHYCDGLKLAYFILEGSSFNQNEAVGTESEKAPERGA